MTAIPFISFTIFLLLNVPIAVSLALATFSAIIFSGAAIPLVIVPQRMFTSIDSFPFMAIPFFMLAGAIMESGGISKRLVAFAKCLVGSLPGGMGIITVLSCGFFGVMTGSNAATVAAIGGIMIPAMEKDNYPSDYACAVTAAAGTLGVVTPPSVPMITYAVISGASIGAMFIAGFMPALLMIVTLIIMIVITSKKYVIINSVRTTRKELISSFFSAILAFGMPLIILGGIYGGFVTPTEAAAVAVVYALIVSLFIYRELKIKDLYGVIIKAGKNTATVLFVIATSGAFSWLLTSQRIPDAAARAILSISDNYFVIMFMINILLLVLGLFLETNALILLLTPMLLPIAAHLEVNLIVLGLIIVVNTSIGMLTPPLALNVMIAAGIGNQPLEAISRKVLPFLFALITNIFIITYFPEIILFLPRILGMNV